MLEITTKQIEIAMRLKVIEAALRVWQLRYSLEYRKVHPLKDTSDQKLDLYDIGDQLNISPQHKRRAGEPQKSRSLKERVMRVAVIRMTNRANALISNAEIGIFPSYEKSCQRKRWTPKQQKALDKAVADGKWMPAPLSDIDWVWLRQLYVRRDIW